MNLMKSIFNSAREIHPLSAYIKKWESFNIEERRAFRRSAINWTLLILGILVIAIFLPEIINS